MARAPRPGEGKTRLRGVLSDEACVRLQEAFLRHAIDVALEARVGAVHLAYTPADAASWAESEFGGRISLFPQQGDGLGARMLAALQRVEGEGFVPLLVMGTDTPLLQPRHLRMALDSLNRTELCLGPSADGGYYLLACRSALSKIFDGVPWGTNRVLATTFRLAEEAGLRFNLIETLYDIDTPDDLARLREDLATLAKEPAPRAEGRAIRALPL
jgi:hypothetical protein